ncbi:hypothetical protein BT63DRAFT_442201 [Microthyrium microscopicum]|uniref:Uncharacterized protein n=1 Tax=Microthyrium microscopicum TaxID=703497 RepID=A0A6A6U6L4_9PEZI|nr:hypothetical protein BT63DRAFT_442201 [Microthyrium microscopicum]
MAPPFQASLDRLLEHVLNEIAIHGPQGVTTKQFKNFVVQFYKIHDTNNLNSPSDSLEDDIDFLSRVWKWLQEGDDFVIGKDGALNHLSFTQLQSVEAQNRPEDPESETLLNPHIRIYTTEKRIWLALANSDPNPKIVPSMEFQALQIIATYREAGIPQSELTKISGQDKRSVPKRTSNLADKGLIEKIPIFIKGHRTSLLRLARYGKETGTTWSNAGMTDQIFNGTQFDLDSLVTKIVEITKTGGAISIDTLYGVAGIVTGDQDIWKRRSLSRGLERLEILGLLERFSAPSDLPHLATGKPRFCPCIRLLRQPTKEDRKNAHLVSRKDRENWRSKLGLRRQPKKPAQIEEIIESTVNDEADADVQNAHEQSITDSAAPAQLTNDHQDQEGEEAPSNELEAPGAQEPNQAAAESVSVGENNEEGAEKPRRINYWDPRRHPLQIARYVITQSGYTGLTTRDARQSIFGQIFYRPAETLLSRITDNWQNSQPPHLRHLAIIRDTQVTNGNAHYVYKDIQAFKAEADKGNIEWKVIMPKNHKFENLVKPKLDKWGFPLRNASFYEKPSLATITTTAQAFKDPIVQLTKREPHLIQRPGEPNKFDLQWFRRARRPKGLMPENPFQKKRSRPALPENVIVESDLPVSRTALNDDASRPHKRQKTGKTVRNNRPAIAKAATRNSNKPRLTAATIKRAALQPVPVGKYTVIKVKKKGRPTKDGKPSLVLKFLRKIADSDQEEEPVVVGSASKPRHFVQPPKDSVTVATPETPVVIPIVTIDEILSMSPPPLNTTTESTKQGISLKRKKGGIISFHYSQNPFPADAEIVESSTVVPQATVPPPVDQAVPPANEPTISSLSPSTAVQPAPPPENINWVAEHNWQEQTKPKQRRKMKPKEGISLNTGSARHGKIQCAVELLRLADGVFGGDGEFVKPFINLWKKQHPGEIPPDRNTVNRTFKNAFANNEIKRIGFNFIDRKGKNVIKHLIYLPETEGMNEPFKSPLAQATMQNMIRAYPNYWLHSNVEFRKRTKPRVHVDRYHRKDLGYTVVPQAPDDFAEELVNAPEALLSLQERKRRRDDAYADQQNRANAPVLIASPALWSSATEARQMFRQRKAKHDKTLQDNQRKLDAIQTGLYDHFSEPIPNMKVWGGPTLIPLTQPEWNENTRTTTQAISSSDEEDSGRPSKRRRLTTDGGEPSVLHEGELDISLYPQSLPDPIHARSLNGHIFRPTTAAETILHFHQKLIHPVQTFNAQNGTVSTDFRIAPRTAAYDFVLRDPILNLGEKPVLPIPRPRKRAQATQADAANADDEADDQQQAPPRKQRRKMPVPEDTQEMQEELKEWRASGHKISLSQDRKRGFVNYSIGHKHRALKPRILPLKMLASSSGLGIGRPPPNKYTKAGKLKRKPGPRPRVRDADGKPLPKSKLSQSLPQQDDTAQETAEPPRAETVAIAPAPEQPAVPELASQSPEQTIPSMNWQDNQRLIHRTMPSQENQQLAHAPMPWHDNQQLVHPPMPWQDNQYRAHPPMPWQGNQSSTEPPMPWQQAMSPPAPEPEFHQTLADLIPAVSDYHPSLLHTTSSAEASTSRAEAPIPVVKAPWHQEYVNVPVDPVLEFAPPTSQGFFQGVLIPTPLWAQRQPEIMPQPPYMQRRVPVFRTAEPIPKRPTRADPACIIDSAAEKKLIYGVVVLGELAGGANGYISWRYLDPLFDGYPNYCQINFKNRWTSIKKSKAQEIQCIREEFRTKFLKAYKEGLVPRVNLRVLKDCHWPTIVEWAMKNVQVMSGQRIVPRPGELHKYHYTVTERSNTASREAYGRPSTTNMRRRRLASNYVSSVPLHRPKKHKEFEKQFIRSWARGVAADRNVSSKYPLAAKMLYSIKNKKLEAAMKDLMVCKQIKKYRGKYFLLDPMKSLLSQKRVWKMEDFERAVAYKEKLDNEIKAGRQLADKRAPAKVIEDILNAPLSGSEQDRGAAQPITVRTQPIKRSSGGISAKKAGKKAKKVPNKSAEKTSGEPLTTVGGQITVLNGNKAADKELDKVLDGRVEKKRKRRARNNLPLWRFKPSGEYAELTQYIDDAQAMVVTELCAAHQLRTLPRLPPTVNKIGAPWPRLSVYGFAEDSYETKRVPKERFFWDLEIEALDNYVYGMPLTDKVAKTPVPMRPKKDSRKRARLPYWSIFGTDVAIDRWIRVLHMIIHRATTGAGVTTKELVVHMKDQLELWEVELAIDWMVEVGVMRRVGSGVSSCGYWWALLPLVKKHWEMQQALKEGKPWVEWKVKYDMEQAALAHAEQLKKTVGKKRGAVGMQQAATAGATQSVGEMPPTANGEIGDTVMAGI